MSGNDVLRPRQTYLEGLAAGELRYQRCAACAASVFYPRVVCNHCGSEKLSFHVSAGRGTVYSTTAVARRDQSAYSVVLVDLDEGFRLMSTVLGIPAEEVEIGMPVRADFEPASGEEEARVVFFPRAAHG